MPSVVLVHGVLGSRHYWSLFRRRLEAQGFAVHEVTLPAMLGDIPAAARRLQEALVELRRLDASRVNVVAHSAGGLVGRYLVQKLGGEEHVAHLVLLGTPHKGTWASYFVPVLGVAAQSMPGSALLRELDASPVPKSVRITNYWSPLDGVVVPGSNAILDRPGVRNVRLARMHHWGYLLSADLCDRVARLLKRRAG